MHSDYEDQLQLTAAAQQQQAGVAQLALTRLVDDGRREQEAKRSMVRHVSHEIRYDDEFCLISLAVLFGLTNIRAAFSVLLVHLTDYLTN